MQNQLPHSNSTFAPVRRRAHLMQALELALLAAAAAPAYGASYASAQAQPSAARVRGAEVRERGGDKRSPSAAACVALEERIAALESKEEIRSILLAFSRVVDSSDPAELRALAPKLHPDLVLDAIDFDGKTFHFEGLDGVITGFGPIMIEADANLAPSAIDVTLEGDVAYASFKFANSVKPPPQLGLDVQVKVLLFAANNAVFVREAGAWKLLSIELVHSLAYPGSVADL